MKPARGRVYRYTESGASATAALVVSEDDWNMWANDSVVVPLYDSDSDPALSSTLCPPIHERWADCTLVGAVGQEHLGEELGPAPPEELTAVEDGIRLFLDLERLITPPRLIRPPSAGRADWWPRRGEIFCGTRYGDQRERYGIVTDDEWNVRHDYACSIYLTHSDKSRRRQWQVAAAGGNAILGDIQPLSYAELERRVRPEPSVLTRRELTEIGRGIKLLLRL